MADESLWRTKSIPLSGGTRFDIVPVLRDAVAPGSLINSQNFESGEVGGYARIKGYEKYDEDAVPGSGAVLGSFVYNNGVLACRGTSIYFSTGSGWGSDIAPSARTGALFYRASKFRWSDEKIVIVDGVNDPVRFVATTGTDLTNAPAGATCVSEFKNHLFFGKDGTLTWSAPNDDTTYTTVAGGGTIIIGDTITNLKTWRNELYVFCKESIHKLSGNDASDFAISTVTQNIGCVFPDTVQELAGDLVFLGPDGLRPISGTQNIGDVNLACISTPITSYILDNIAEYREDRIVGTCVHEDSQYRLFFSRSSDTSSPGLNACLVNGQGGIGWEFFPLRGIQVACSDTGLEGSGSKQLTVHGDYSGYVYRHSSSDSFDGDNIVAYIDIPYLVFEDPVLRKTLYKLKLYVSVEDQATADLLAQVSLNDGDSTVLQPLPAIIVNNAAATIAIYGFTGGLNGSKYGTAVYGQVASTFYRTNLTGSGYNASLRISSNNTLPQYTIRTVIIEYTMEARQ